MRLNLLIILSVLIFSSCQKRLKGEGDIEKNTRLIMQEVKKINLSGNFDAVLIQDNENKVVVEAQDNIVLNLTMNEEDGELSLVEKVPAHTSEIYKVYIYTTGIDGLELSENVNFDVSGELKSNDFKLDMTDNTICNAEVFMEELELNAKDNSKIALKGNCSDLDASLSDNAKMVSPKFVVSHADVDISDNVEANFKIIKELKGESSDNAVLEYGGNPDKKFETNDKSRLIKTR